MARLGPSSNLNRDIRSFFPVGFSAFFLILPFSSPLLSTSLGDIEWLDILVLGMLEDMALLLHNNSLPATIRMSALHGARISGLGV